MQKANPTLGPTMSRPISGKHSIEVANFACVFEQPFATRAIQSLMTLKEIFKDEFPVFSIMNLLNVRLDGKNIAPTSTQQIAGVSLQRLNEETKKPIWAIRTEPSAIVVSCFSYDRWSIESKKAIDYLVTVIKTVDDGRNPVNHLVLHVVDRFIGDTYESYMIDKVFNTRSKYLSKQAIEAGPLWHVHQGWFKEIPGKKDRMLHNLNLSTNDTPHGMLTTIDHSIRYNYSQLVAAADVASFASAKEAFDTLHEQNKAVVVDLLKKSLCRKIKLCP